MVLDNRFIILITAQVTVPICRHLLWDFYYIRLYWLFWALEMLSAVSDYDINFNWESSHVLLLMFEFSVNQYTVWIAPSGNREVFRWLWLWWIALDNKFNKRITLTALYNTTVPYRITFLFLYIALFTHICFLVKLSSFVYFVPFSVIYFIKLGCFLCFGYFNTVISQLLGQINVISY